MGQNATTRELLIRCDCGFEAQGVEEALFLIVKEHTSEAHNAKLIDEEVLARVLSAGALKPRGGGSLGGAFPQGQP